MSVCERPDSDIDAAHSHVGSKSWVVRITHDAPKLCRLVTTIILAATDRFSEQQFAAHFKLCFLKYKT